MGIPILGIFDAVGKVIDKIIPDPQKAAEAKLKMAELQQAGEFKELDANLAIALGQIETNKIEAAAAGLFKGGWRPATGWVCVAGLAYTFLLRPLLPWLVGLTGATVAPLPAIDFTELTVLLGGLLGLGGLRTLERVRGKA